MYIYLPPSQYMLQLRLKDHIKMALVRFHVFSALKRVGRLKYYITQRSFVQPPHLIISRQS